LSEHFAVHSKRVISEKPGQLFFLATIGMAVAYQQLTGCKKSYVPNRTESELPVLACRFGHNHGFRMLVRWCYI